jgi:hypothetical protein
MPTRESKCKSSTTVRENVYLLLRAIYIRFSNAVKKKFGFNSTKITETSWTWPTEGFSIAVALPELNTGAQSNSYCCPVTGLDQPCPETIPAPSFTTINWSAATSFSSSCVPLGQRMAMSAVFSDPSPKCSLESFVE